MTKEPRLRRGQGRGGPYGLGSLGGYGGPTRAGKPGAPPNAGDPVGAGGRVLSRRALLGIGGALTVAVFGGGGSELILHTIASPGSPLRHLPPDNGQAVLRTLQADGIAPYPNITGPPSASPQTTSSPQTTASPQTTESTTPATQAQVVSSGPSAPSKFFGPSAGRHVYITIDDGYFPDNRVIDLIRSEKLPITTFLIAEAASEHLSFWKSYVRAGGQIQNHTYSHPDLTKLSQGDAEGQWARANQSFAGWFGRAPTIGRPPYGAVDHKVAVAAREAGLKSMILWSALDDGSGIQTWNSKPIGPGSIVLLHWTPGLYSDLGTVLQAVSDQKLVPAFLTTV